MVVLASAPAMAPAASEVKTRHDCDIFARGKINV